MSEGECEEAARDVHPVLFGSPQLRGGATAGDPQLCSRKEAAAKASAAQAVGTESAAPSLNGQGSPRTCSHAASGATQPDVHGAASVEHGASSAGLPATYAGAAPAAQPVPDADQSSSMGLSLAKPDAATPSMKPAAKAPPAAAVDAVAASTAPPQEPAAPEPSLTAQETAPVAVTQPPPSQRSSQRPLHRPQPSPAAEHYSPEGLAAADIDEVPGGKTQEGAESLLRLSPSACRQPASSHEQNDPCAAVPLTAGTQDPGTTQDMRSGEEPTPESPGPRFLPPGDSAPQAHTQLEPPSLPQVAPGLASQFGSLMAAEVVCHLAVTATPVSSAAVPPTAEKPPATVADEATPPQQPPARLAAPPAVAGLSPGTSFRSHVSPTERSRRTPRM